MNVRKRLEEIEEEAKKKLGGGMPKVVILKDGEEAPEVPARNTIYVTFVPEKILIEED